MIKCILKHPLLTSEFFHHFYVLKALEYAVLKSTKATHFCSQNYFLSYWIRLNWIPSMVLSAFHVLWPQNHCKPWAFGCINCIDFALVGISQLFRFEWIVRVDCKILRFEMKHHRYKWDLLIFNLRSSKTFHSYDIYIKYTIYDIEEFFYLCFQQ